MELLRAGMTAEQDEADLLLDEVAERAPVEGDPWTRGLVAAARARAMLRSGRVDESARRGRGRVDALVPIRDGLPEGLRRGFRGSPWVRPLEAVARGASGEAPELLAVLDELGPAAQSSASPQ
jgi:hypothetical protein